MREHSPLIRGTVWSLATAAAFPPTAAVASCILSIPIGDETWQSLLDGFSTRAVFTGLAGIIVAIYVVIPYTIAFALWLAVVRRYPHLENSWQRLLWASLILSLPLAGGWWQFLESPPAGASPHDALLFKLVAIPGALVSAWLAVYLPRVLLPVLRRAKTSKPALPASGAGE